MKLEIDIPSIIYNDAKENRGYISVGKMEIAWKAIADGKPLEQEPTTKNDLGVDYRSLEDIKKLVESKADALDGVMLDASGVIIGLYFAIVNDLPSVTPIRPKGHWIDINEHHYYNDGDIETTELRCSCCNEAVEWDIELLHKPYFCENCGADMRVVTIAESEET